MMNGALLDDFRAFGAVPCRLLLLRQRSTLGNGSTSPMETRPRNRGSFKGLRRVRLRSRQIATRYGGTQRKHAYRWLSTKHLSSWKDVISTMRRNSAPSRVQKRGSRAGRTKQWCLSKLLRPKGCSSMFLITSTFGIMPSTLSANGLLTLANCCMTGSRRVLDAHCSVAGNDVNMT